MILSCYAAVRLLCSIIGIFQATLSSTASEKKALGFFKTTVSGNGMPIQLFLLVENAVAISLIASFHPVTLLRGTTIDLPLPSVAQNLTHCAILFAIEQGFRCVVHKIFLRSGSGQCCVPQSHGEDSAAFSIADECIVSKGTLILAMALIGGLHPLGVDADQLHVMTMVIWAVIRQCFYPLEFKAID